MDSGLTTMMELGHPVVLEPVSIRKRYITQPYFASHFITNKEL